MNLEINHNKVQISHVMEHQDQWRLGCPTVDQLREKCVAVIKQSICQSN